jgi:CheY-like chemotaxis protein
MTKTILDVGQCGVDGPRMTRMLRSQVGVRVESADTLAEAAEKLAGHAYALVLVNRELAFEGTAGVDLVRAMKAAGDATPVMLVSDRAEAQDEAVAAGAVRGFGKSEMNEPGTVERIRGAMGG